MPRPARLSLCRRWSSAFTLLEMCIVLFIIVLLLGVTAPSIQSAFVEQQMREDARAVALMVRTAMQQSLHEHRGSTLILTPKSVTLDSTGTDQAKADLPAPITHDLLASNRIFLSRPRDIEVDLGARTVLGLPIRGTLSGPTPAPGSRLGLAGNEFQSPHRERRGRGLFGAMSSPRPKQGMVLFELVIALFIFGLVAFSLIMALDATMDANRARNQADAAVRGLENQLALLHGFPVAPTDRDLPDDGSGRRYHLLIDPEPMQDQKKQPLTGFYRATITVRWMDRGEAQEESLQQLLYQP